MVTVGLVVIGVILIGLPLLALLADKLLPPPKARPLPPSREPADIVREEFSLGWQDHLEVVAAVQEGRAVARPELRPAATRLGGLVLHPPGLTFRGRPVVEFPRWQRRAVLGAYVVAVLVFLVVMTVRLDGDISSAVTYVVLYSLLAVGERVVRRRRRQRAADAVVANR